MSPDCHPARGPSMPSQLSKNVVPLGLGPGTVVDGAGDVVEVGGGLGDEAGEPVGAEVGEPVGDPAGAVCPRTGARDVVGAPGAVDADAPDDVADVAVVVADVAVDVAAGGDVVDEGGSIRSVPVGVTMLVGAAVLVPSAHAARTRAHAASTDLARRRACDDDVGTPAVQLILRSYSSNDRVVRISSGTSKLP